MSTVFYLYRFLPSEQRVRVDSYSSSSTPPVLVPSILVSHDYLPRLEVFLCICVDKDTVNTLFCLLFSVIICTLFLFVKYNRELGVFSVCAHSFYIEKYLLLIGIVIFHFVQLPLFYRPSRILRSQMHQ